MDFLNNLIHGKKECNLVLSAGGMRCLAHIGAIQALEEEGWVIKSICAISGGSIVAALYSHGVSSKDLQSLAENTDFNLFKKSNFPRFNRGLLRFNGLGKWVIDMCKIHGNPSKSIELFIAACSLTTGNKIVFNNPTDAKLALAVEATCSIPLIFEPVQIESERYVDGALWSSAPVHFYIDSKLPTIVINAQNSHVLPFTFFDQPLKVLYRVFEVFQINRLKSLKKRIDNKPVYIFEPTAENVSALAFKASKLVKKKIIESSKLEMIEFLNHTDVHGKRFSIF